MWGRPARETPSTKGKYKAPGRTMETVKANHRASQQNFPFLSPLSLVSHPGLLTIPTPNPQEAGRKEAVSQDMPPRSMNPKDMVVLITGATAGFGRAAARRFGEAGAKVSDT